jgi:hypothetical protein
VVEDVAEPEEDVGFGRQRRLHRRLEGLLEVALSLVGSVGRRAGVVLAPEVGVAQRYEAGHETVPSPRNDMRVTIRRRLTVSASPAPAAVPRPLYVTDSYVWSDI